MADIDSAIARYYAVCESLSAKQRERVEFARGQASAYLWGRMDSGDRFDSEIGDAFSWAYATVAARMESSAITSRPAIRESWESFRENGTIWDHAGRTLNTVSAYADSARIQHGS